ncbi:hypothetical protein WAI453_003764 [Rhynchosporium graminicola]
MAPRVPGLTHARAAPWHALSLPPLSPDKLHNLEVQFITSKNQHTGLPFKHQTRQLTQCKFAVKSGGHAAFAGASNTDDGVTIDLVNLNQLAISSDGTETAVGAGNLWHDVYSYLEVKNRTVVGGRVSAIGVGGLTTGGGIAFVSGRYGWACDNVNKYEVVFADGTIHNVT